MNLADITTKCYILALIIRDDGERLLLGDGAYEFKDTQQHFQPNTYANDVVELQGTDGQMLAGQVRRTAVQTFSGYIGDATFSQQAVESARRDFMMFFRKQHFYTAVYIFKDGTAIQRKRGYIVNAPSVPELWQKFPEWSIGLNFEDPNYYEYAENNLGEEIYAHIQSIDIATAMSGGLVWDAVGAVAEPIPISASKNLMNYDLPTTDHFLNSNGSWTTSSGLSFATQWFNVEGGETMVFSYTSRNGSANLRIGQYRADGSFISRTLLTADGATITLNANTRRIVLNTENVSGRQFVDPQLEIGSTPTSYEPFENPTQSNGFVWEAGGTGGVTTVTVDGVDSAEPIWTVTGPATNPTLTNITTGQTIEWTGTVPSGQTLVVDMDEMTASLEGANVFQFITGSWVTLQAGNNRVSYAATGATDPSTLSWNGVVG